LTGTLTVDGAATRYQTTRAGQTGRYTFSGTAGQGMTMRATAGPTYPYGINVDVYRPDGGYSLANARLYGNYDSKLDLGLLPVTGTYTVVVIPTMVDVGTVDVRVVSEATGTLVVNAAATSVSLGAAQNGRYTFSANVNDVITLVITSFSTNPTNGYSTLQIFNLNGGWFFSDSVGYAGSTGGTYQLQPIPATGVYALRIMPNITSATASMSVRLTR
jgi:hypothetical protein